MHMWVRFFILVVFGLSTQAFAQSGNISTTDLSRDFLNTGVALSMGGAYRALANSTQAILYNPAGIRQHKGRMLAGADYAYLKGYEGHQYGGSMIDTQTSREVAYGVSFHRSNPIIGGVGAKSSQLVLSVAHQAGRFFTGGSLKGYLINVDSATIEGPKGIDLDVGVLFRPSEMFSVAVVGYNLVRGSSIEEYPLQLAVAGAITIIPQATFTIDAVKNFNTSSQENVNLHLGGTISLNEQFAIRGGYAMDRVFGNDYYGVGLSVKADKAHINFAFGQTVEPRTEIYSINLEYLM
ncbi:MAG: hypothetical protein R3A45_00875 [Bdellovibrionota bacterium]|nr:hypothetical protein [Deltaproteobacteria bacterium]